MRKILLCILAFFLFNTTSSNAFYAVAAAGKPKATAPDQADLRSRLLLEGFGLPEEFDPGFGRDASTVSYHRSGRGADPMRSTLRLAVILGEFNYFPAVYSQLRSGLFDRAVPLEARWKRFCGQAYILGSTAAIIYSENPTSHYSGLDIADVTGKWEHDGSYGADILRADLPAKKALAEEYMLTLLKLMEEGPATAGLDAASLRKALWHFELDSAGGKVTHESWPFLGAADRAALVLVKNRRDAEFNKKARAVLAMQPAAALDRLDALESLAASPEITPALAVQRAPFRNDLKLLGRLRNNSLDKAFWFTAPDEGYARLAPALAEAMRSSRLLPVAGLRADAPATGGAGLEISAIGKAPTVFLADGPLYLLYPRARDSRGQAYGINKRLVEEGIPVFGSSALSALDGPVLLPLTPARQQDAKLLSWYATVGSAAGDALLVSSAAPREQLINRLLAWHLMLGKTGRADEAPPASSDRLLIVNPAHGDFLLGLLPHLRGESAGIFLQPGECLWFAVSGPEGSAWHRAGGRIAEAGQPGKESDAPGLAPAAPSGLLPAGQTFLELDAALTEKLLLQEQERQKEMP